MKAKNPYQGWMLSLREIINKGKSITQKGNREFSEITNYELTIDNVQDGTNKIMDIMQNSEAWMYPSRDEIEEIVLSKEVIPGLKFTYGRRIMKYGKKGINQLDNFVIPLLNSNMHTKRALVTLWEPANDARPVKTDTPSFVLVSFFIRDNKLNVTAVSRNLDYFFGWPAHFHQIKTLQDYVLKKVQIPTGVLKRGSITTYSFSALVFNENIDYIRKKILE